ncbi:hypothetical protein [Plebeiibacterium sediminum]|uniref:Uncharacterized protein n=1 Tax=Plebeiibacterium sediminum TaxID=2992112 RepID=A0AAE3M9S2_9BACT|nr:hypothetical protein [Plebeiobacterium sediminum]MCW3789592.1 hypothetical protein [Plebeiobacterium sediminum]
MENKKEEEFAKSILSNSKLNIENADFNKVVMNKIRRKNRKKILLHNLRNYSLIFVGIDLLIITLLRLLNIRITEMSGIISKLSLESMSAQLFLVYFVFLIVSIFIIVKFSENGYLYSKTDRFTE